MSKRWALYWVLVAATLGVYLAMVLWTLPKLSAAAGGLAPFDLRPTGYSLAEARAFLAALGPGDVAFYRDTQHRLDAFYPALLAAVLAIGLYRLTRNWPRLARVAVVATAVLGGAFDYLENAAVAAMLRAGADGLTTELAGAASRWTMLKSAAATVALAALFTLLLTRLLSWARTRRRG